MKLSLRNLALCGSLMLAGAAMAQTPTVKMDWQRIITPEEGLKYNESRAGAGINDKFYFVNKEAKKLLCYDHATDKVSEVVTFGEDVSGIGVGVTVDDAGNVLVEGAWAGPKAATDFVIVNPETKEYKVLNCALPDGFEYATSPNGRNDFLGRVAGNMLDPDGGAIFYIWPQQANNVIMYNIVDGVQNTDNFSFYTSTKTSIVGGTMSVCQPRYSYEELVDMGDDAVNGAAIKQRNSNMYMFEGTAWTGIANIKEAQSSDGFDIFTLGDVEYRVVPYSETNKYGSMFAIADMEGNIIYKDERGNVNAAEGYNNGASILAHKINDNTVEIYTWYPQNPNHYCAKFTVSLPAEPAAPLYVCGAGNGLAWEPATPMVVNPEADGSYKFTISNLTSMKISSVAGTWDDFNTAALFFVPTEENLGQELPVEINGETNIDMPWKGDWTITISADKTKAVCTTTTPKPIGAPDVYVRGAVNGWGSPDAWKFSVKSETEDQYIYMLYCAAEKGTLLPTTSFKIADDSWGQINYGGGKITAAQVNSEEPVTLNYNGNDISLAVPFTGTLEFHLNKDLANKNGVVLIFHANQDVTAVEAIEVEEGEAVYYNLQGVKVANPENGMYLKVVNGKASKVLVK